LTSARRFGIKILLGDRINIELSPYDLSHGRIAYRHRLAGPHPLAAAMPIVGLRWPQLGSVWKSYRTTAKVLVRVKR
jgi:hypothetical protein